MDDLDVLESGAVEVLYRGDRLHVRPITIGAVPRLVREARPVINALLDATWLTDEGGDGADGAFLEGALSLVEQHADGVCKAVSICINREADWVQGGNVAEFFDLVSTVLEVNRDFFTRRIVPLLGGRLGIARGAGQMPSSS